MIQLLKKSKFFLIFIILLNISSLVASELNSLSFLSPTREGDRISQLYNEDGLLVYDEIIRLVEDVENGNLDDNVTEEEWNKIVNFIVFLSRTGQRSDATEEEKAELEKDIQELLYPSEDDYIYENSFYNKNGCQVIPAIYYGQSDVVLCKSWFKKQYKNTKKYVKKHKTAFIVATIIVVAIAGVGITMAVTSPVAASSIASAGAAAASKSISNSNTSKSNNSKVPSINNSIKPPDNPSDNISKPNLPQSIDKQINDLKNTIVENNLLFTEYGRIIGSTIAHEKISNISHNISDKDCKQAIIQEHIKVDKVFSTDQTSYYLNTKNLSKDSSKELQEKIYYFQGQEALNIYDYDQAIDSFGKAIEINPNNHNVYLDKAYAHLKAGEFDKSLNDYHVYNEQKNNNTERAFFLSDSIDFSLGVRTGIAKGTIGSGKELLSFAANAITHPIDTTYGIYEAFSNLSKLACSQEWRALSKAIAPEICTLVNEWKTLSAKEKGEKSGYILGKYGTDILVPGAAAKVISKGMKGAKEIAVIARNLQKTEKLIVMEAFAGGGGVNAKNCNIFKKIITKQDNINNITRANSSLNKISKKLLIKKMKSSGFSIKGKSPDGKFLEFIDKEGRLRAKIHPPDKITKYNHLHLYDECGNSLNSKLKKVSSRSIEAHIEIGE